MFGPKGPRSRGKGAAPRASEPARRGSVEETVVIEAAPRRRSAAASAGSASTRTAGAAAPVRTRLVDLASDWLATVLALGEVSELPDAAALRARALELKSRFEREAAEQGFLALDAEDSVFAMIAFLDETILLSKGAARDAWIGKPMQLELYGRQLAGEEFFERLERLRRERESRIEALEVYVCCLAFGFMGKMRLGPPERVSDLLATVQQEVAAVRGAGQSVLAPNAGRRAEQVAEESGGLAWWIPPAVFVPAVAVSFLIVWLIARLGAGGAADAIRRLVAR